MDVLPYFLALIKKNLLLSAIITTGNFTLPELKNVEHYRWSEKNLEFKNFSLSKDDNFSVVRVIYVDTTLSIMFISNDAKYFDHSDFYFGKNSNIGERNPIFSGDPNSSIQKKTFRHLELFKKPVFVSVRKTSGSSSSVTLLFNASKVIKQKPF